MTFADYRNWYRSLHYTQRWFVVFILLRPVIDNFYYLKHVSPLLSPLYIVGVLTPVLCLWSIFKVPLPSRSATDQILGAWLIPVSVSVVLVVIKNFTDLKAYEVLFQTAIAYFIFFFARRMVRSARDLDGILFSTLLAAGVAALFFLYELFFQPLKDTITRGLDRLEGAYADVTIYGIYVTQSFLIACYFMLRRQASLSRRKRTLLLSFCTAMGTVVLIRIIHVSSTAVTLGIAILFILFYLRRFFVRGLVILATCLVLALNFGGDVFEERFYPLIRADVEAYQGERDEGQVFHGRLFRWEKMWDEFSAQPLVAQLFGMALSVNQPYKYITAGTHNDYLRVLFLSGFIGFALYLVFLFSLLIRAPRLNPPFRFLLLGTLATLLLFSISTGPNLYAPLIYVVYPVFTYALLPDRILRQDH